MSIFWIPEQDETLVCIKTIQETSDVKTFVMASPEGKLFAFEAGQYFTFEVPLADDPEMRCYSISSATTEPHAISITVKQVPGGKASNWLHANVQAGTKLTARGPAGAFTRQNDPAGGKYLFLSGGSGITPMMSMLRSMVGRGEPADIIFVHAARSPADIIFRRELEWIASRNSGIRLHFLPESPAGDQPWTGLSGRISSEYLRLAVPDLPSRKVMCCGPAPFMQAARTICLQNGVPETAYLEEHFSDAPGAAPSPPSAAPMADTRYSVSFSKQGKVVAVSQDETILKAAKAGGVRLSSSCANGVCGTCKSRLVSGKVDMRHGGGIRQKEIDAGFILPCCSRPLTDLVIDR